MEATMKEQLLALKEQALAELAAAESLDALKNARVRYLGKKGPMTEILRGMGKLPAEERPRIGQIVNEIKSLLEKEIGERGVILEKAALAAKLAEEKADITLPGRMPQLGHLHPVTLTLREIKKIFMRMGFDVCDGPEIEDVYHNFTALNLPPDHPALDMQDSFYITENYLLRTQTSGVQARTLESMEPNTPIRMICPGAVYRCDYDATHSPMFHQVEGLVVDKDISLADLKGTLELFSKQMFGEDVKVRLRPSYFPFTEPSVEVDVSCPICHGRGGCHVCKDSGWLEILGAGVVHPNVLRMSGYDPEIMTGFAFGLGVERIAMLKYGIDDLRLFFENDQRFINQFK